MAKIIYQSALPHGAEIEKEIRAMLALFAPAANVEFQTVNGLPSPKLILKGLPEGQRKKLQKLTIYDIEVEE